MRGEHLEPGSKMAGAQGRRHGKERGKGRGLERFKWTGSGNTRKPPNNILEQKHRDRPCRMRQVVRFSDGAPNMDERRAEYVVVVEEEENGKVRAAGS